MVKSTQQKISINKHSRADLASRGYAVLSFLAKTSPKINKASSNSDQ